MTPAPAEGLVAGVVRAVGAGEVVPEQPVSSPPATAPAVTSVRRRVVRVRR
ncbi:hypothetical protein ACIBVL_32570 [Streptomyces sp. NPDC049687]|uniref:hypothetical protein n=1 Tax=Streptomyces sp. NPDC049687 TaxID=3365596 RepID=UPI0037BC3A1B